MNDFEFAIGLTVYFVLGEHKGIVTGHVERCDGKFYLVTWEHDMNEKWHTEIELSEEPTYDTNHGGTQEKE